MSSFAQKLYAFGLARYFDWLCVSTRRPLALFFRDGGIGDILCTFPAAVALAERHPRALKIYCTHPGFVSLPATLGRFDRVLGIKCSDLVAQASRRHTVYRFRYPDEDPGKASQAYLADEFSQQFGLGTGLAWPKLDLGAASSRVDPLFPAKASQPTVCIHTGPSWTVREWPLAAWDELVDRLKTRLGCHVLHIGSSRHFQEGERKERAVQGTEDCRDRFSLLESLQIIARSQLVVGIDSGMIHGAVAMKTPVVGIFGPTSGRLRLPASDRAAVASGEVPCLGCHHRHPRLHWKDNCPYDIRCMRELSAEQVFAMASRVLASR